MENKKVTWIKAAAVRAIKTVAQTAVAMIGTSMVISEVDWLMVGSASLLAGLLMTRVFKKLGLNLPDVTAFLLAGLAIGPYGLGRLGVEGVGFVSMEAVEAVGVLSQVALGFIAFSIGNEFLLSQLKTIGKQAFASCAKLKSFSVSSKALKTLGNGTYDLGDTALEAKCIGFGFGFPYCFYAHYRM